MEERSLFPIFLDFSEKKVVVAGAGTIAKRRVRTLTEYTDNITLIAPEVNDELLSLEKDGKIRILRRHYEREDLYGADLVIAASGNRKENMEIHAVCKCMGILVNIPNDSRRSDFVFPSVVRNGPVVAGVTSGGANPMAAKKLLEQIRLFFAGSKEAK